MAKSAAAESRKPPRIQKHAELVPEHRRLAVRNEIEQGARRIIAVAQRKEEAEADGELTSRAGCKNLKGVGSRC